MSFLGLIIFVFIVGTFLFLVIFIRPDLKTSTKLFLVIFSVISGLFIGFQASKSVEENDKRIGNKNLVDYLNNKKIHRGMSFKEIMERSGLEPNVAFVIHETELKSGPGPEFKSITTLPKQTKINLNLILDPGSSAPRQGDWFKVGANDTIGWINGNELRPAKTKETFSSFLPNVKYVLKLIFPEDTLMKKILGVLYAVPIAIIVDLILLFLFQGAEEVKILFFRVDRNLLSFVAPLVYLMMKNHFFSQISPEEYIIIFLPLIFVAAFASLPAFFLSEFIQSKIMRK